MIVPQSTPFDKEEYDSRLRRVRSEMERRHLDALLVIEEANITYLTGYLGQSGYVPQLLWVGVNGELELFLRDMDVSAALHTSWLSEDDITPYPEELVGSEERDGFDFIFDRLPPCSSIGLEKSSINCKLISRFVRKFGQERISDATGLVTWIRIEKSDTEIQVMSEAAEIADLGIRRARDTIRPGVKESDAAAEISAALIRGTPDFGAHDIYAPYMPSGTKTGTAHLTWTDQPYRTGSSVNIEIGAARFGYVAAIMRTVSIGAPSDRLLRLHEASQEGLEKALQAARPGQLCEDVAIAFNQTVARHGYNKASRSGYSIGIGWLEESASLRVGDRTVLKPGMVFHLMLGMWVARDFGHVISETFCVSDRGAQSLSSMPRELIVVE